MFRIVIRSALALVLAAAPLWAQTPGPRATIGVAKFDANESFRRAYGDTDLGGGLSAMLVSALERSKRFIVVERAELHGSLAEQKLTDDGLVHRPSGARSGKLIGARFLVYGSVTQFEQAESSSAVDIGFSRGGFLGGLQPRSTTGRVGIVLRVVDTTTGRVVETIRVKRKTVESGVGFNLGSRRHGFDIASSHASKTPVGKAAQEVIDEAVRRLVAIAGGAGPWRGLVVAASDDGLWLNAGTDAGLRVGQVLVVERESEALTDPVTGEVLDRITARLGEVRVVEVRARVARAVPLARLSAPAQRGDLVLARAAPPSATKTERAAPSTRSRTSTHRAATRRSRARSRSGDR